MDYEAFVETVRQRAGLPERPQAERSVRATLGALGERLVDIDARAVVRHLPAELSRWLQGSASKHPGSLAQFYEEVGEAAGVARGFAMEHAQVVCQVLAESLDDEARKHLGLHLPQEFADLFRSPGTRGVSAPENHRRYQTGEGRTLASGRPGSGRPLSEASGYAHAESLVASDNPREDRKISSARGTSQEQRGETLATGKPGSKHPVSESG